MNKIYEEVENNRFFLFGCDSKNTVSKIFYKCIKTYPHLKDKFILITAETQTRINDPNVDFKNKFVFYSPKITYGVDFNMDISQNVFIYVKGRTLTPYGIYQQCTRTRNIDSVYFYCECFGKAEQYKTLKELEDTMKDNITNNTILNNLCSAFDDDDEFKVLENTFFKLYCYNEYIRDVFETSKYHHLENILTKEGFDIVNLYEPKKLDRDTRDELTELIENLTQEQFDEYVNDGDKDNKTYECINKRASLLNLDRENIEQLTQYKDILMNKYKLSEHLNVIKLLKSDEHLTSKLQSVYNAGLKTNLLRYDEYKLLLVRAFEGFYHMGPLEVGAFERLREFKPLDKQLFNNIVRAFGSKKKEPESTKDLLYLYLLMIRHLTNGEIVNRARCKRRGAERDTYTYSLNEAFVRYHIEVNEYSNKYHKNYHECFIDKYKLRVRQEARPLVDYDFFLDD